MYAVNVEKLIGKIAEKGFTKSSFAGEIGVCRDTLRSYLRDYKKIPYDVLTRMAAVLECNEDDAMAIFFAK